MDDDRCFLLIKTNYVLQMKELQVREHWVLPSRTVPRSRRRSPLLKRSLYSSSSCTFITSFLTARINSSNISWGLFYLSSLRREIVILFAAERGGDLSGTNGIAWRGSLCPSGLSACGACDQTICPFSYHILQMSSFFSISVTTI